MKLLTDDHQDLNSFKLDFKRACRAYVRACFRGGQSPEEAGTNLTKAALRAIYRGRPGSAESDDTWDTIERIHASDWMVFIVHRWLDHASDDQPLRLAPDEFFAETFMGIAQHVAQHAADHGPGPSIGSD